MANPTMGLLFFLIIVMDFCVLKGFRFRFSRFMAFQWAEDSFLDCATRKKRGNGIMLLFAL